MDLSEHLARVSSLVDEHGVCIQHVGGGADGPGFSYTVGLFLTNHPELLIGAFPIDLAGDLLRDLANAVLRSGMRFGAGDRVQRLVSSGEGWLLEIADPCELLRSACALAEQRSLDASSVTGLQVVFADVKGRWPWDAGSEYGDLPILGPIPDGGTGRDLALPSSADRRSHGW